MNEPDFQILHPDCTVLGCSPNASHFRSACTLSAHSCWGSGVIEVRKAEGQKSGRNVALGLGLRRVHPLPSGSRSRVRLGAGSFGALVFSSAEWEFFPEGLLPVLAAKVVARGRCLVVTYCHCQSHVLEQFLGP